MKKLVILTALLVGFAHATDVTYNVVGGVKTVRIYETAAALGIQVVNKTNYLVLSKGGKVLKLGLNNRAAIFNGQKTVLPGVMSVDSGKQVNVPLEVFSKYFGLAGATLHDAKAEFDALVAPPPAVGKYHVTQTTQSLFFARQDIVNSPTNVGSQTVSRLSKVDTVVDTCRKGVLNLLKAPSSAKFPDDVAFDILQDPSGVYLYASEVSASNPMGVLIRNRFSCFAFEQKDFIYAVVQFDE